MIGPDELTKNKALAGLPKRKELCVPCNLSDNKLHRNCFYKQFQLQEGKQEKPNLEPQSSVQWSALEEGSCSSGQPNPTTPNLKRFLAEVKTKLRIRRKQRCKLTNLFPKVY